MQKPIEKGFQKRISETPTVRLNLFQFRNSQREKNNFKQVSWNEFELLKTLISEESNK